MWVLRNEQEDQRKKEMEFSHKHKKRMIMREAPMAMSTHPPINVFSLQSQPSIPSPSLITLSQLQLHSSSLVSTGLRLSSEEQNQQTYSPLMTSAFFSDELSAQINQHKEEMDNFILSQSEQLRRTLAEKRQLHYRALLGAAEESASSRRLREKEAELERAVRHAVELEDRLARLRTESMAWQAKAVSEQAAAASLHAQLQHAASAAPPMVDVSRDLQVEDAESVHVDPDRLPRGTCWACRVSAVSVVMIPCRHLCLCAGCDAVTAGQCCPVCRFARTGSVQVFPS